MAAPPPTLAGNAKPPSSNSDAILASLPPIAPSIGFSASDPIDLTAENPSNAHPAATPSNPHVPPSVKVGNRLVITAKAPRKWAWKSFSSSARRDGCQFSHWVRDNVEYADYPYARFDVSLDPLVYTDEEYKLYLEMTGVEALGGYDLMPDAKKKGLRQQLAEGDKILPWTKGETDALVELARACDLRWPVIVDRWHSRFGEGTISRLRRVEDLQHRYYTVGSVLAQRRAEKAMAAEAAKLAGGAGGAAGAGAAAPSVPAAAAIPAPGPVPAAVASSTIDTENGALPAAPTAANQTQPPARQQSMAPAEVEALQQAQKQTALHPSLAPPLSLPATGTAHRGSKMFDLAAERARRGQMERLWNRSKEEEREEERLRAELRSVEAQLRKLKKGGKHLVPAGSALAAPPPAGPEGASPGTPAAAGSAPAGRRGGAVPAGMKAPPATLLPPRPPLDPFFTTHAEVAASFTDTAPVPTPGTPYLQSGRLFPPSVEGHAGLNKSTLKQMGAILEELKVPKEPIATKRSCDLYDGVRKDALALLILQKMVLRKEAELNAKKAKLAGMKKDSEEAAAAAAAAKNESEKKPEAKADAKAETKGAKGKKATTAKAKGKRPRADSGGSQGSAGKAGEAAKKAKKEPKEKKPRKKSAAKTSSSVEAAVAAAAASIAQSSTAGGSLAAGQKTAAATLPPASASSISSKSTAADAPKAAPGKQKQPSDAKPATATSTAAAAAPLVVSKPDAPAGGEADAKASSSSEPPPVVHPGKAPAKATGETAETKKPGEGVVAGEVEEGDGEEAEGEGGRANV